MIGTRTTAPTFEAIEPPRTKEDVVKIVRHGCRDINGAAEFAGLSRSEVWAMVQRREVWSFKRGRRRLIPVVELRRYLAAVAMEEVSR